MMVRSSPPLAERSSASTRRSSSTAASSTRGCRPRRGCDPHPPERHHGGRRGRPRRNDTPIVVICRSGNRSELATTMLQARGFEAHNLEGGIEAWVARGPARSRARRRPPAASPDGPQAGEGEPPRVRSPERHRRRSGSSPRSSVVSTSSHRAQPGGRPSVTSPIGAWAAAIVMVSWTSVACPCIAASRPTPSSLSIIE